MEAPKAVVESFLLDDCLDSVESPEKPLIRLKEFVDLLHFGAFKLTIFVSNVPDPPDRIDGCPQSTASKIIVSSKEESMHVLGVMWDDNNNSLVLSRGNNSNITKSLRQRLVSSLASKVYDPIDLVAPFTVGARLILKDIWRVNWRSWDDGEIVLFVLGEIRVAVMKVMTFPMLELRAALLAARLKKEICQALNVTVNKVFVDRWSCSGYIQTTKTPSYLQILECSGVNQWSHISTCNNPADAAWCVCWGLAVK